MQVNGKKTTVEQVQVEIDPLSVLMEIYQEYGVPDFYDFLGEDGYWYTETSYNHHINDPIYTKSREATPLEIEERAAYLTLARMLDRK